MSAMQTELYRRQHEQLRTLLEETASHLVPLDADACRAGLARLSTVLNVHLALEDRALYPRLITHDDASVRETAQAYQHRMGRLAADFQAFYERWKQPGAIEATEYDFAVAYRALSQRLRERMDMEDSTLYRLVDAAF